MVNSGRLSVPAVYDTPLSTADVDTWAAGPQPGRTGGRPAGRANGEPIYLTETFKSAGNGFVLLENSNGAACDAPGDIGRIRIGTDAPLNDTAGLFVRRYDATQVRPICCARMVMSPRASGIRRCL
jgi:3-(3-hydroxy-phenyl)propionate hydroxylase